MKYQIHHHKYIDAAYQIGKHGIVVSIDNEVTKLLYYKGVLLCKIENGSVFINKDWSIHKNKILTLKEFLGKDFKSIAHIWQGIESGEITFLKEVKE